MDCRCQFVAPPPTEFGDSDQVRRQCLKLDTNGLGFRAIERVRGVHHTTVINGVKPHGQWLLDACDPERIPAVAEFRRTADLGRGKNKLWIWMVVDHCRPGLLGWVVGDRSGQTCEPLWAMIH